MYIYMYIYAYIKICIYIYLCERCASLVVSLRAYLASVVCLSSLAAGASRPQDPLRTDKSQAVTAAFGHLTFAPRSSFSLYIYLSLSLYICIYIFQGPIRAQGCPQLPRPPRRPMRSLGGLQEPSPQGPGP